MNRDYKEFKMLIALGVSYLALLVFGSIPGIFVNYGYDYYQYLGVGLTALIVLTLLGGYWVCSKARLQIQPFFIRIVIPIALTVLSGILFWFLRTEVHCFGGDGAVSALPQTPLTAWDFVPHGRRLDGFGSGLLFHFLNTTSLFTVSSILPSILTAQIYAIVCGVFFVSVICFAFRKNLPLAFVVLTMPMVFNFFGNIDAYTFSLVYEAIFLLVVMQLAQREITFSKLLLLGLFWGIGLWTHPFHVFDGFLVVWFASQWLKGKWKKCPAVYVFLVLYCIVLIVGIKCSKFSNCFFVERDFLPPSFSVDTFTHWLNHIALPLAPFYGIIFLQKKKSELLLIPLLASFVFFILAFTLGASDQFLYAHLTFILSVPLLLCLSQSDAKHPTIIWIVFINLFLLIPMVAVHSSDLTIQRAQRLYPIDPCRHNRVMSWQTHLTLVLGDNLQSSPAIRQALLTTAYHGARYAEPARFRAGNYCYYVAWHYHFGLFNQGQQLLANLLRQSPDAVRMFLGERPGFIYRNRDRLWQDIETFFPTRSEQERKLLHNIIEKSREQARRNPYERVK